MSRQSFRALDSWIAVRVTLLNRLRSKVLAGLKVRPALFKNQLGMQHSYTKSSIKAIEQPEESEWILGDCEPFIVERDAEIKQDSPVLSDCSKGDQESVRSFRTSKIKSNGLDSE